MSYTKEQVSRFSLLTLVSWLPLLAILWTLGRPFIADAVAAELSQDFDDKIAAQTAPIKGAFSVLILQDIADRRRAIADAEFRRDNDDDWTADDAQDLVNLRLELESLQQALRALMQPVAETSP